MAEQFQFHQQGHNNSGGGGALGKRNSSGGHSSGLSRKKKPDYCWNFNKGIPCKFGKKCRFVERCSFCDSPAHGNYVCPKLGAKSKVNDKDMEDVK